jgi:hypothetical protein
MFTKEQLAQIIKEETAAVLAEQEVNEGPFSAITGGISKVGGDIKKYAGDVVRAGKTASVNADIKKQIAALMKQNAATLKAMGTLFTRADALGIETDQLNKAYNLGLEIDKVLRAQAETTGEAAPEPLGDAPAGGAETGEPTSPKA